MSSAEDKYRAVVPEAAVISALRRLTSADAQEALARVYACAALFHAPQSVDVAEARASEEAAMRAMERIATGLSTDLSTDLAVADKWAACHSTRVKAEAQMASKIAAVAENLMRQVPGSTAHAKKVPSNSATTVTRSASLAARAGPEDGHATPNKATKRSEEEKRRQLDPQSLSSSVELHKNIVSEAANAEEHDRMNVTKGVSEVKDIAVPASADEADGDDGDAPAAMHASTRMPSPRETALETALDGRAAAAADDDAPLSVSTESSSEEAAAGPHRPLAFPKLTPPVMSLENLDSTTAAATKEVAPVTVSAPKRLCFEDYGFRFTQMDFEVARDDMRQQRTGTIGNKAEATPSRGTAAASMRPSALLCLTGARPTNERAPPPPRQVEDAGLHYVRRQLSVRHLQPFACPLKALTFRLAEGDSATASSSISAHASEDDASPRLSDPLMIRMLAELQEVCRESPVPRVRVRPDAQVYRKDRGYFKADEARLQLHVEVVPVSGPMAGEAIHVWVRVPAGYPFVAPRAHLTVELPHRRCTGVAVDKVPHLVALSYDAALPNANAVCPAPVHTDEVEQLRPLQGPVNNGWRSSLTLRHVLIALTDLFNSHEFAATAKELQNDNLMHNGLQRARVSMYEEEEVTARNAGAATATSAATAVAASKRSSNDEDDATTTGDDSMGVTINSEDEVAPSHLLLCNGPFLTKPPPPAPAAAAAAAAAAPPSPNTRAADASAERANESDVDDDDVSMHTAESTPSRRNTALRRRQRKPLAYCEMEGDRLCGPWRGCWGHILYSGCSVAATTTATTTGVTTSVSSPIRFNVNELAASAGLAGESSAFATSPTSPSSKHAPQSLTFSPLSTQVAQGGRSGSLFVRIKHHNPAAPAATVRLVRVPASTLRDHGAASPANTPVRRARGRVSPQSTWASGALGTSMAAPPPNTAWASAEPPDMETEVLLCIHDDDERTPEAPSGLAATLPRGCERQHVCLHDLREGGATAVSSATSNHHHHHHHTGIVTSAIVPPGSPMTVGSNSTCHSESAQREEDGSVERCYALVVDVPESQRVSIVFSSDEAACLSMPWDEVSSEPASKPHGDSAVTRVSPSASGGSAVVAAAQLDAGVGITSHKTSRGGLLVEFPYDAWQFHAASAGAAVASGAKRDEDIHPHWPRNVRFHGGQRVVPLALKESTFRMYQLLQNTQAGSRSSVHTSSYLAAAPFARVRQVYAATRTAKDHEAMVRRYGFWGWRNVLLPVFSPETRELVQSALQAASMSGSGQGDAPRESSVTSARMLATALYGWEEAAIEDFGSACVQMHREPDASMAYRAPYRTFAVLRALSLTAAYALEVMQALDKNTSEALRFSSAEVAALQESLYQVLWHATVLAVASAAVRSEFLEVCVVLVGVIKQGGDTSQEIFCAQPCAREVRSALSQLTELQRGVAQVLAASVMSAFPKEAAALLSPVSDHGSDANTSALPSHGAATSLTARVKQLLNAPATPVNSDAMGEFPTAISRVSAYLNLIKPS